MEEDRDLTNLGPELPEAVNREAQDAVRQPRKRFIGRRAAAERAATRGTVPENGDQTTSDALSAPKPTRPPRTVNQIPSSILDDPSLKAAMSHLPSNYSFEIHKTIHRIQTLGAKNIALQFPEGLLMFAPLISDILQAFCPGTETLIMGDVTYGACCVDDFTARALGCDLLVHYGHSCLVPVDTTSKGGIKTLYVFVTIGIDVEHLIATIERNFQSGKRIALVGTIQFNATLHAIIPRLRQLGFDPILPRSAPLSAGEILGCTAPTLTTRQPTSAEADTAADNMSADMILYVGDGRFHLEAILISSPSLRAHTYRYDPYARKLTHESFAHEEMHSLRSQAIRTAKRTLNASAHPRTWGLILGTLGRQGNPHTLSLLMAHLTTLGIPYITLLLSEISPQKLALMENDVAVWVQVACPRLSIDWGYAFSRPLLSPYEALVAVDVKAGDWRNEGDAGKDAMNEDGLVAEAVLQKKADNDVVVYPMNFYAKEGLGRTRVEDIPQAILPAFEEVEVR